MQLLFASLYILPASLLALGIWMVMRLLRALGVRFRIRRVAFAVLATVLLAPAIVPAGIIMIAVVPNGLLALSGSLPMLHQPRLITFAACSYLITGLVAGVIGHFLVNDKKPRDDDRSAGSLGVRFVIPVAVIGALLAFYYAQIPDRKIPEYIDRELVESAYGHRLDAVAATLRIEAIEEVWAERQRLHDLFDTDPTIVRVSLYDRRLQSSQGNTRSVYVRLMDSSGRSCSSTGDGKYRNEGLMRCTWDAGRLGGTETLEYERRFTLGEDKHVVEIEFDYAAFLDRYPVPKQE